MMLLKKNIIEDTLVIEFLKPVKSLSSTVLGDSFRRLTHAIFHRVDKNFNEKEPWKYARDIVSRYNLPIDTTAVFLTAVDVAKDHIDRETEKPIKSRFVATIGFSPLACVGKELYNKPSTINMLIVVDKNLSYRALAELTGLISSLKTLALVDLGFSCSNYGRAYATVTDAFVVASEETGSEEEYCGPATIVGSTVSNLVYNSIIEYGLKKMDLNVRFKNIFGVDVDWLIDTAVKLYMNAPIPNVPIEDIRRELTLELPKVLKDPNIWALGLAARSLDNYGLAGTIPYLKRNEYINDSTKIVADELLGIAFSIYVNGWKGMFSYYWIDRIKEGLKEFKDKPMFIDDILASFIGSILSKVYDKYLNK